MALLLGICIGIFAAGPAWPVAVVLLFAALLVMD